MLPIHQAKIDERTKADEANRRYYPLIFVHVRQTVQHFSQVSNAHLLKKLMMAVKVWLFGEGKDNDIVIPLLAFIIVGGKPI